MLVTLLAILMVYLATSTVYLIGLAVAYYLVPEKKAVQPVRFRRFAIIVPAHNEELLVGNLCKSLLQVKYPADLYEIFIVADNCSDDTSSICRHYPVRVLERLNLNNRGKGQALAWALKEVRLEEFDAVFIVDADNVVDTEILSELNVLLESGEQAIQCFNAVGNREDSWFTRLLYVSRIICNQLYHEAKYRLGLSSYLMGNGLCFSSKLLRERGWTAFSVGEDWEYYTQLVESGVSIGFGVKAKVYHQESRSLNQATSQRLRWSSGRFRIARTLGWRLLIKGIKERNWIVLDASFPLVFPNYSLLINLTGAGFVLAFILPETGERLFFLAGFGLLLAGQFILFLAGVLIAGSVWSTLRAAAFAPFFLVWKAIIDFLCVTGLYQGDKWVRTRRHKVETPP
jgi:cellulose synthase/poly-beta-1,6-N-acetylglucosamine synthase-like glycosyltransferase